MFLNNLERKYIKYINSIVIVKYAYILYIYIYHYTNFRSTLRVVVSTFVNFASKSNHFASESNHFASESTYIG